MLPTVNWRPDRAGRAERAFASTAARGAGNRPRRDPEAELAAGGRSLNMREPGGRGSAACFSDGGLETDDTNEAWRTGRFLKGGGSSGVDCRWRRRSCWAGFGRTARWTSAGCEAVAMAFRCDARARADED